MWKFNYPHILGLNDCLLGVGDMAKISYLCYVGFTILSEQRSQNNFPIIKTFQGNKI